MSETVKINDNCRISYNEEEDQMDVNINNREVMDYTKTGVALGMTCGALIEIKAASALAKSDAPGFWKFCGVAVLCSNAADLFKRAADIFVKPENKCNGEPDAETEHEEVKVEENGETAHEEEMNE
jgi:hypothetical protein